jgi:hypothetical protein
MPDAAAQTRIVSVTGIRLNFVESVRSFKGIISDDVSEFESYHPSQAVRSLCGTFGRLSEGRFQLIDDSTVRQLGLAYAQAQAGGQDPRLTGQNLSPRSVRVGGDDRVRTHCVSLLVPSEEAADSNHQHASGEANRKLHRNVVADGGQQDLAEHREQDPEAEHL